MWEAYLRQVHEMANETSAPRGCFSNSGKHFRARRLSGRTQIYLITEADAEL